MTGAGAGYAPIAPGTAGTVVALPVSFTLNRIAATSLLLGIATLASFIALAWWLCERGEERFAVKDSPWIVIDEIAGFQIAGFLLSPDLRFMAAAFFLFRFFDIIKVFPARRLEKLRGGAGVIMDDLVAGLYTFILIRLLMLWRIL